MLTQRSGIIILVGVGICVLGIIFAGAVGTEGENSHEQKLASIREFNLPAWSSDFCGVMSSCFAFGLDAGNPIMALTLQHGQQYVAGLPVLVVACRWIHDHFIWCAALNKRNRSYREYLSIPGTWVLKLKLQNTRRSRMLSTRLQRRWPEIQTSRQSAFTEVELLFSAQAPHGTCSFSSIPWAKRRWDAIPSSWTRTWQASSYLAPCGVIRRGGRGVGTERRLVLLTLLSLRAQRSLSDTQIPGVHP
jgi:hypothetical protein